MKVLLVFPPWFNPTQPYLGLFELRAVLRLYTMWEIDIFDWAIESYRSLLTLDALGEVEDGDCMLLSLTGNLKEEFGSTPITGEDVVRIVEK